MHTQTFHASPLQLLDLVFAAYNVHYFPCFPISALPPSLSSSNNLNPDNLLRHSILNRNFILMVSFHRNKKKDQDIQTIKRPNCISTLFSWFHMHHTNEKMKCIKRSEDQCYFDLIIHKVQVCPTNPLGTIITTSLEIQYRRSIQSQCQRLSKENS